MYLNYKYETYNYKKILHAINTYPPCKCKQIHFDFQINTNPLDTYLHGLKQHENYKAYLHSCLANNDLQILDKFLMHKPR